MHLDTIRAYAPAFLEATKGMSYIRRGVFWSELLAFAAIAKAHNTSYVVESGTGLGHSASVLASLFDRVITIGLESPPPHLPGNVTVITGDAWENMWAHCLSDAAVLIDGPKHGDAVLLAEERETEKDCCLIAIHDCARGMPARPLIEERWPQAWFTDDPAFVAEFGHLDRECLDMAASRGKTFPDHGPPQGIIVL